MAKRSPVPGERHNMLTYVEDAGREPSGTMGGRTLYAPLGKWRCDCGKEIVCRNRYVLKGSKKSCGCLLHAKGEAWHRARSGRLNGIPVGEWRFLVTIKMLPPEAKEIE